VVILCEDKQHAVFARRFLKTMGWRNPPRIPPFPEGRGSGEQFVREQFPKELAVYRSKRGSVGQALIVIQDGDDKGVKGRRDALEAACKAAGVSFRKGDEHVAIFIPTWEIETWFAYLHGEAVDEARNNYPDLKGREKECQRHVGALAGMCREVKLREPAPPSLRDACEEFRARIPGAES
jgi:hypothetical protein